MNATATATAKTAHIPSTVLKLIPNIRKDVAYIVQTITDEHGADSAVSARMLRYTLADAASAFGKRDSSAMARGLVYLVVAYLNGTNGLDGLCKPLPKWLSQAFRATEESIRPFKPMTTDVLMHVEVLLCKLEHVGAAPKKETVAPTETMGTINPVNPAIPTHGTAAAVAVSAQFARREKQRATTAKRIRALRATIRALIAAQQETPKAKRSRKATAIPA